MPSPEADLLKLSPGAGLDEIKKAYRKAALVHHPDHNPDPHAARHFRRITEAYRLLSEAARTREPPRPREVSPAHRLSFLLSDLRSLAKRWPPERWARPVDGLPATVWVAGILDVLVQFKVGPTIPIEPRTQAIAEALEAWGPAPELPPLSRSEAKSLTAALDAAEARLRALDRPARRPAK